MENGRPYGRGMPDGPLDPTDPRVALALERTFLAWHRTALALTAGAVALAGFAQTSGSSTGPRLAAVAMIAFAGVLAGLNDRHRRRSQVAIREGAPLPESRLPLILTIGVLAIAAVAVVLVAGGLELR
jgi:putative membrane protein